ncbi:hypothetical protein SLS62_003968 [Diatrype stigma]|uniref:ribonuclease H n=1 Tax=Diatrype stigma TaxID=117547 RepID=A0AAN9UVM4_9PEZI
MADQFYPADPADAEVVHQGWAHPSYFDSYNDSSSSCRHKYSHGEEFDASAIVIAVDGACRGNGMPWARAAYGVYFGPDHWRNEGDTLNDGTVGGGGRNWTSQRAELWGALRALRIAQSLHSRWPVASSDDDSDSDDEEPDLEKVIIKADSEYLVKGMTSWVYKWMDNGWENCKGLPVVNADLFGKLVNQVRTLKGLGVEVLFWKVPRAYNWQADELANDALDADDDSDSY